VTYVQTGELDGKKVELRQTKTYTLRRGATYFQVQWRQENTGEATLVYCPAIKHVGGTGEKALLGPSIMVLPQGPSEFGDFLKPATDWEVRLSGKEDSEALPMVAAITDYRKILQQFTWCKPPRYTLETIYLRANLKPGDTFEVPFVVAAMANLRKVAYVEPELAASVEPSKDLQAGQPTTLTVRIAAGIEMGEKRLEGQIATAAGDMVTKVPNQQVQLLPGKISAASYTFTPPKEGVYFINLTVFDRQQPIRLGTEVNSQKSYVTMPIVVGPSPEVVVQNWQSDNTGYPRRKEREVKPWRTLLNSPALKVGQVLVPDRIFPEDKLAVEDKTQPASIRLAGGEYECLQFVVALAQEADPMTLTVMASRITNDQGVALEQVQVREQIYLTTETPSDYMDFPIGQWPDPLFETDWPTRIPNAPIAKQNVEFIRKCHKRVYWVTVRAQPDAQGGICRGTIGLALAGKPAGEFPVEVKVNSFALPKRPHLRCSTGMVGWHGNGASNWEILGLPAEAIKEIGRNAMDSYWRQILEYGWTPTMWFGPAKVWEQYKDVGRGPSVFPSSGNKEDEDWLVKNGLLRYAFTYAPFDEHPDGKVPEVVEWAKKWKAEHRTPILDCYYGGNVEPLFGLVDVWTGQSPLSPHWGKPTPPLGWGEKAVARKAAGDQFFSCNASLIWHVEFVPAQGRSEFWNDFAAGVDGRYVYSTCRWTPDVYRKNWTTGNYMGCLVYPGPSGVTTSIRLETLRDSVEDYDYLAILRETARKAKASGAASADKVQAVEAIVANPKLAEQVNSTEAVNRIRDRIADLIEGIATVER
jgi:hypothetical protein